MWLIAVIAGVVVLFVIGWVIVGNDKIVRDLDNENLTADDLVQTSGRPTDGQR